MIVFSKKKSTSNADQSGGKAPSGQTPPKRPTRLWPAPCLHSKYYSCASCQHNSKCNKQDPERIFWRISVSKAGVYINAVTLFVLIVYTFATIMLVKFGADGIKTQMDVANTSGAQAMDALKAQQRPWIRIVEADAPDTNVDESSRIPYIFPAKVENVRNIPAVDVVPLGYSVVPISSYWEKRKLPPVSTGTRKKFAQKV